MKMSFMLYLDQYPPVEGFTLAQKGMLLDAFFVYNAGREPEFDDPLVALAFGFFRQAFDRDAEKYERKCRTNRENVNRRYRDAPDTPDAPDAVSAYGGGESMRDGRIRPYPIVCGEDEHVRPGYGRVRTDTDACGGGGRKRLNTGASDTDPDPDPDHDPEHHDPDHAGSGPRLGERPPLAGMKPPVRQPEKSSTKLPEESQVKQPVKPSTRRTAQQAESSAKRGRAAAAVSELEDIIAGYTDCLPLRAALEDFRLMRERLRKPMTGRALKLVLAELDRLAARDDGKIAVLEQSIMRSWQGVFPLSGGGSGGGAAGAGLSGVRAVKSFQQRADESVWDAVDRAVAGESR